MAGLLKPKTYKIEDSNLALFGTPLEKQVKAAAAQKEHSWDNAGTQVGVLVWRIEQFKVKAVPAETYGSFYSGDSYIILQTYKKNDQLAHALFFWLGDHTTQDEAGTAAYKTVELDDRLSGSAPQSRETQGNESPAFVALFPHGIKTMEGGVDTGFHHVGPTEYKPRLLQIRPVGQHHVAASQVEFSSKSLNKDDCYIIDMGLKIYQVAGANAVGVEKSKAMQMSHALRDERDGKPEVIVCSMDDSQLPWEQLGGKPSSFPAAPADAAPVDKKLFEVANKSPFTLGRRWRRASFRAASSMTATLLCSTTAPWSTSGLATKRPRLRSRRRCRWRPITSSRRASRRAPPSCVWSRAPRAPTSSRCSTERAHE